MAANSFPPDTSGRHPILPPNAPFLPGTIQYPVPPPTPTRAPPPRRRNRRRLVIAAIGISLVILVVSGYLLTRPGRALRQPLLAYRLNQAVLQPGTLTWGGDLATGAPYLYTDPQSHATTGLDAALIQTLAQRNHLTAAFQSVAWQQFPPTLRTNTLDLFASGVEEGTIPPGDAIFTSPYLLTSDEIVVRMGDTRFTNLASLEHHSVGALTGDRALTTLKGDPAISVVASTVLPFEALAAGRVDAVVISSPLARWYVAHDTLKRFAILAPDYHVAPVALALSPTGPHLSALRANLNDNLRQMALDGSLRSLLARWNMDNPLQACVASANPPATCPALG